jgi:hypothetical protein
MIEEMLISSSQLNLEENKIFFLDDAKSIIKFYTEKMHKDPLLKILNKVKQSEDEN